MTGVQIEVSDQHENMLSMIRVLTVNVSSQGSKAPGSFMPCADPEGLTGGLDPPEKSQKYRVLEILVRMPWKFIKYQASIQCWAIIGTPAKRH